MVSIKVRTFAADFKTNLKAISMRKPRFFFVKYNGTFIAQYKTIRGALGFISRKKLQDDYDNSLNIFDNDGEMYDTTSGKHIEG